MNKGTVTPKTKYNKKDIHGNINDFFRKKSKYFQRCWQFDAKTDS